MYSVCWLYVMQAVAVASTSQLEQQIAAVWPDDSEMPEDRIKRLAAGYLLQQEHRQCYLTAIGGVLKLELAKLKEDGSPKKFKHILHEKINPFSWSDRATTSSC